ncbi:TylF/MycF/NovP-related O-methyltransferase [Phyllobacterium calauticae]|uniref:TylF/MycF/NovP-related O-methyltransferase n=1 Tax=Phyllobacterium calauticae TaxID=2817027 RepID=UPI001CBEF960|nr:TylF/MycF/NovP-related O-methyltransferase [Phyllobacterium calauticae]MBZ3695085.1 class I SAM-dependent methyltransferase [Phyllobacterium calauticae]
MLQTLLGKLGFNGRDMRRQPLPTDINVEEADGAIYDQDGLRSIHNHDFMRQPSFNAAYLRGITAAKQDYMWHWRVHVGLWAASVAAKLKGDFVECGVNKGFLSSSIMQYLDWNSQGRMFFLLDTFAGLDTRFISDEEVEKGAVEKNKWMIEVGNYITDVEPVRENFSQWQNVKIIQGAIPETLNQITTKRIAFASIDMNCSPPEVAAMEFLWPRLVDGAMVVFDDYAYNGYRPQKVAMDQFANDRGVTILSLPTGQGLLVKSPGY